MTRRQAALSEYKRVLARITVLVAACAVCFASIAVSHPAFLPNGLLLGYAYVAPFDAMDEVLERTRTGTLGSFSSRQVASLYSRRAHAAAGAQGTFRDCYAIVAFHGGDVEALVIAGLVSENRGVRIDCCEFVGRLGTVSPTAAALIALAGSDWDERPDHCAEVASRTYQRTVRLTDQEVVDGVKAALKTPVDSRVRDALVEYLGLQAKRGIR